jgi:3-methyladenine DNA glycosylase/8-oxoguanine DNA glycosylase
VRAIHARFVNLLGGEVTAERVLARSIDDLRLVGLSNAKPTSIMDLARKTADGTAALERVERLHYSTAAWYCWQTVDNVLPTA